MKKMTTDEIELRGAEDIYRHGPRSRFWFGSPLPFRRRSEGFSFSDRFVLVYFVIFVILLVLGIIAVFKTSSPSAEAEVVSMLIERSLAA